MHMASILATAVKLKEIEGTLTGRVKFIFQPANFGHGAFKIMKHVRSKISSIGFS